MNPTSSSQQTLSSLSLAALGVVFGDIGTSPLYAIHASLYGMSTGIIDILGVLSLILWALILVVSLKYLCIVLSSDNEGEGGILVLLTLLLKKSNQTKKIFFILAIFGAGLMLGDGMLTPAISVISSMEGLKIIAPDLSRWIIPASCVILLLLFVFQFAGTTKIGFAFGPFILIWFIVIGALGLLQIIDHPVVLYAINPKFATEFLIQNGWHGYAVLGGVFLVVTGGEALYADLGHFGKKAIRLSWFLIVLPGLLLNYFGQAGYLLSHPAGIENPFFLIAPTWFLIPLLIIATIATIIASQAVISATYSMTKQAILLGLYPHLPIIQTSNYIKGQIYIPQINFILAVGTLLFVILFKNTNALTHAYGIAVNLVMFLTTILVFVTRWLDSDDIPEKIFLVVLFGIFTIIDMAFLGSNLEKIITGGWIPILIALLCAMVMYTWKKGMEYLRNHFYKQAEDLSESLRKIKNSNINVAEFTGIFITDIYDKTDGGFLNFIKLNHILPKNSLIVAYTVENIPYVATPDRYELSCLDKNICKLTLHYGFMDYISIPQALYVANDRGLFPYDVNLDESTYFIETPNVVASQKYKSLSFFWQERLFAFLMRNYSANVSIEFYQLPYDRTISIGTYCVI